MREYSRVFFTGPVGPPRTIGPVRSFILGYFG